MVRRKDAESAQMMPSPQGCRLLFIVGVTSRSHTFSMLTLRSLTLKQNSSSICQDMLETLHQFLMLPNSSTAAVEEWVFMVFQWFFIVFCYKYTIFWQRSRLVVLSIFRGKQKREITKFRNVGEILLNQRKPDFVCLPELRSVGFLTRLPELAPEIFQSAHSGQGFVVFIRYLCSLACSNNPENLFLSGLIPENASAGVSPNRGP